MLDNIDLKLKLKIMYILTIVIAGGFGLLMLIVPSFVITLLSQPAQDLYLYGVAAAIWTAFGLLAFWDCVIPSNICLYFYFSLFIN